MLCSLHFAATFSTIRAQPPAVPLKTVAEVALPGTTSRFDYQSVDAGAHRSYMAHLGAGTVIVFDTQANKVLAEANREAVADLRKSRRLMLPDIS